MSFISNKFEQEKRKIKAYSWLEIKKIVRTILSKNYSTVSRTRIPMGFKRSFTENMIMTSLKYAMITSVLSVLLFLNSVHILMVMP